MKAALLIGNGLNRCYLEDSLSWEALMKNIASDNGVNFHKNNSFPLEFECMINDICKLPGQSLELEVVIKRLKKAIADSITYPDDPSICSSWIHNRFLGLGINEIMTTNYDYFLEKIIAPSFANGKNDGWDAYNTEKNHSIFRRYQKDKMTIRHIHGEALKEPSICLGYDHYTRYLNKISTYLTDVLQVEKQTKNRPLPMSGEARRSQGKRFYGDSWMELFFTHDVHIVGLSLDVCEIDLWWLLTYRAKLISKYKKFENTIKNTIHFYYITNKANSTPGDSCENNPMPQKGMDIVELFTRLHIECHEIALDTNKPKPYEDAYGRIADTISQHAPVP